METAPSVIALIEDDLAFGAALRRFLRASGFQADMYPSAEQFLEGFGRRNYGCLLLDLHLPGLSGLELMDHLRRVECRLPVILMTADVSQGTRDRAGGSSAIGFLQKPVEGPALIELLRRAVVSKGRPPAEPVFQDSLPASPLHPTS